MIAVCAWFAGVAMMLPSQEQSPQQLQEQVMGGDLLRVIDGLRQEHASETSRLLYLAYLQQGAGDYAGCRITLQGVLAEDPGNAEARLRLANTAWALGRYAEARSVLGLLRGDLDETSPYRVQVDGSLQMLEEIHEQVNGLQVDLGRLRLLFGLSVSLVVIAIAGSTWLARR